MTNAAHAITHLSLQNFRNYRMLSVEVPVRPVVLVGHNGAGKTNILEAISLLAPGRGLRGAKLRVMDYSVISRQSPVANEANLESGDRRPVTSPWVVSAQVQTRNRMMQIGTGRDGEASIEKRIIKVDGEKIRAQSALTKHICVQWLTPSMDQVFIEGNTARRKLLDRLVYGFDPEHAARVAAYELAMRERNKLLSDRGQYADSSWLNVIERNMAEHAVAMTLARLETINRISDVMREEITGFPIARLSLHGIVEQWLSEGISALEAEEKLADRLTINRVHDMRSGRCSEGVHRSYFQVIHSEKSMEAELCSTGEQKAMLLSLVMASALARRQWCGLPPILLFDEIIAHLDVDKRRRLFDLISTAGIQAWMTGTDAADFQGLDGFATTLKITGGMVS
jgi:DNA replication and repair protein RecF